VATRVGTGEKSTANASVSSCKRTSGKLEELSGTKRITSEKTAVLLGNLKPAEAGTTGTRKLPAIMAMARRRTAEAVMVA
jgi:hypothetical protein